MVDRRALTLLYGRSPEVEKEKGRKHSESMRQYFRDHPEKLKPPTVRGVLVITTSYPVFLVAKQNYSGQDVRMIASGDALKGFKLDEWKIVAYPPLPADFAEIEAYIHVSDNPFSVGEPTTETD